MSEFLSDLAEFSLRFTELFTHFFQLLTLSVTQRSRQVELVQNYSLQLSKVCGWYIKNVRTNLTVTKLNYIRILVPTCSQCCPGR